MPAKLPHIASNARPFRCSSTSAASSAARRSLGASRTCSETVRSVRASVAVEIREFLSLRADRQVQLDVVLEPRFDTRLPLDCIRNVPFGGVGPGDIAGRQDRRCIEGPTVSSRMLRARRCISMALV